MEHDDFLLQEQVRGESDLEKYVMKNEPKLLARKRWAQISWIVFFLSLIAFALAPPATWLLLVLAVTTLSAGLFLTKRNSVEAKDFKRLYEPKVASHEHVSRVARGFTANDECVAFSTVQPSQEEESLGFQGYKNLQACEEVAISSTDLDDLVASKKFLPCSAWDGRGSFLSSDSQLRHDQLTYLVSRVYSRNTRTTNEQKICLDSNVSDICSALSDGGSSEVKISKIGYFDGLVSNEAFRSRIYVRPINGSVEDEKLAVDLTENFPAVFDSESAVFRLQSQPVPSASRHIGISTVAITSDRQLLFYRQKVNNIVGGGKLVASGSGSSDFGDVQDSRNSRCLLEIVKYGMARELCEEGGLLEDLSLLSIMGKNQQTIASVAQNTALIGFFRWVDRCGKPEFIGVTRLNVALSDIPGDNLEVNRTKKTEAELGRWELQNLSQVGAFTEQMIAGGHELNLSFLMVLKRLSEIAEYERAEDPMKKAIHRKLEELLFG